MGKALAEAFASAREVFEEIDEALQQKLSRLMWEGPESDLILTENAQPAIMAASYAVVRILQKEGGLDFARHARLAAGTRWANTPRLPQSEPLRWPMRPVSSKRAAAPCSKLSRLERVP